MRGGDCGTDEALRAEEVRSNDSIDVGSTASIGNDRPAWPDEGCTNGECIEGMDLQQS